MVSLSHMGDQDIMASARSEINVHERGLLGDIECYT